MKLRRKAVVASALILLGVLSFGSLALYRAILEELSAFEEDIVRKDLERAIGTLQAELTQLAETNSTWDAHGGGVGQPEAESVSSHIQDHVFSTKRLNLLVFADAGGTPVYGKTFDPAGGQQELTQSLRSHLNTGSPLLTPIETGMPVKGLVASQRWPLLVSSRPIFGGDGGHPSRGALIMGRFLDTGALTRLSDLAGFPIDVHPTVAGGTAPLAGKTPPTVRRLGNDRISASTFLPDIYGKERFELRIEQPCRACLQVRRLSKHVVAAALAGSLALALLLATVMKRRGLAAPQGPKTGIGAAVLQAERDGTGGPEHAPDALPENLRQTQATVATGHPREQAALLLDSLPVYAYLKDADGRYLAASRMFAARHGLDPERMAGLRDRDLFTAEVAAAMERREQVVLSTGEPFQEEQETNQGGQRRLLVSRLSPLREADGRISGLIGLTIDITAQTLQEAQHRVEVTLQSIGEGVITTDTNGNINYLNPQAEELTGWRRDSALGRPIDQIFRVSDESTGEPLPSPVMTCLRLKRVITEPPHVELRTFDDRALSIQTTAAPIRSEQGQFVGAVLVFRDVTESRQVARRVEYQASHDALTGLFNRYEFERRLLDYLDSTAIGHERHALLYLDLDRFKVVNDYCGHLAGDELLKRLGQRLRGGLRETDLLARLGGDEFGILLVGCPPQKAVQIANELCRDVSEFHFVWNHQNFNVGVSIGLVFIDESCTSFDAVMRAADAACYESKDRGRNRVSVYNPSAPTRHDRRDGATRWPQRLQQALNDNLFRLECQRIQPLRRGEAAHFEILLRLRNGSGSTLFPESFLPAAERYRMLPQLDRWVMSKLFETLSANPGKRRADTVYTVNVSAQSLTDPDFLDFVLARFGKSAIKPNQVCFEIGENSALANIVALDRFVEGIKALGCRFALDDFGNGLSSLNHLRHWTADYIKISGSLVRAFARDGVDAAFVSAINEISHEMGSKTVAVHVESLETLEATARMGIDFAQGYAIARPGPLGPPGARSSAGGAGYTAAAV